MAVSSLAEVFLVVILIVPGFISFFLINCIALIERKYSNFEISEWCLILSVMVYVVFSSLFGIQNIDDLREKIFSAYYVVPLVLFATFIGIVVGSLLRWVGWRGVKKVPSPCWDIAFEKTGKKGGYMIVYTHDGSEYKGKLHFAGIGLDPKELVIKNPKLIIRDKNLRVLKEIEIGKEILFTEKDVRRVVFFKDLGPSGRKDARAARRGSSRRIGVGFRWGK